MYIERKKKAAYKYYGISVCTIEALNKELSKVNKK